METIHKANEPFDLLLIRTEFEKNMQDLFMYMWRVDAGCCGIKLVDNNCFISFETEDQRNAFKDIAAHIVKFVAPVEYVDAPKEETEKEKFISRIFGVRKANSDTTRISETEEIKL